MRNKNLICAIGIAAAAWSVSAAEAKLRPQSSGISQMTAIRSGVNNDAVAKFRQEQKKIYEAQDKRLAEARKLSRERKFPQAVKIAEEVYMELKLQADEVSGDIVRARLAEVEAEIARIRLLWGRSCMEQARTALAERRFADATTFAGKAVSISKALTQEADELRRLGQQMMSYDKFENAVSVSNSAPQFVKDQKKIQSLLREARTYFANKRYTEALDRVEQVYLLDPFNAEASYMAGRVYRAYYTGGYHRHRADFELLNAFSAWQWAEPVFQGRSIDTQKVVSGVAKDTGVLETYNKLNRIIVPQVALKNCDVKGVIDFIVENCKRYDPDKGDVNKRLNVSVSTRPEDLEKMGTVTLDLWNIPMGDLLRYVSLMTGLKYRVENNGLNIGTNLNVMHQRTFNMRAQTLRTIWESTAGATEGSSGSSSSGSSGVYKKSSSDKSSGTTSGDFGKTSTIVGESVKESSLENIQVTDEMIKKYLEENGISFPTGSDLSQLVGKHELIVRNTMENLNNIDILIRDLNTQEKPLVLVELKALEVGDTDLQALGFDWSLGSQNLGSNMDNYGNLATGASSGWMLGPGVNATRRGGTSGDATDGNSTMVPIRQNDTNNFPLINNLNIFPMLFGNVYPLGSSTPLNISLTINAVSQNKRVETVYAPKVMTLSESPGTADLKQSHHYPDEWDDLEIEENSSENDTSFTIKTPEPTFGDSQELGMQFTVTPRVIDKDTISLDINAMITSRAAVDDEFTFTLSGTDHGEKVNRSFRIWKPVIQENKLVTRVDVYDGETVIIGGAVDSNTATYTDKMPFLGELPFIGRLFQSQSVQATKKNLLFFVTARIVDYDGVPVQRNKSAGIPDFNR